MTILFSRIDHLTPVNRYLGLKYLHTSMNWSKRSFTKPRSGQQLETFSPCMSVLAPDSGAAVVTQQGPGK